MSLRSLLMAQYLLILCRYLLFIDIYCWFLILIAGFVIGFIFVRSLPYVGVLFILIAAALFITFVYILGHVRTAFRMKYFPPPPSLGNLL